MTAEDLAPIIIFGFNRPEAIEDLFDSLKKNPEFCNSRVYVYVDGPRNDNDRDKTETVAKIARKFTDKVIVSEINRGLGTSIITGVTEVISRYGTAIVLEDDLILASNFLSFMNEGLRRYRSDKRVMSVCGYGLKIKPPTGYSGDVYLSDRSSSWGWATWIDRWNSVDWEVKDWNSFLTDKEAQRMFNKRGSDMTSMLRGYMEGRNRSWAIRFCYSQFRQGRYSVHPFLSKVENDGFGLEATNCRQKYSRFQIKFDNTGDREFDLPEHLEPDGRILKQLHAYHSLSRRIYSRVRRILNI